MTRRNSALGRLASTATLVASTVLLAGCAWILPSEPEPTGPVSLTLVDGNLAIVQCFAPEIHVDFIDVSVDGQFSGAAEPEAREVFLAEADDSHPAATWTLGQPVVVGIDIPGLATAKASTVEVASSATAVHAHVAIGGQDVSARVWFSSVDLRDLSAGEFAYDDGRVTREPCGMDGAWDEQSSGR